MEILFILSVFLIPLASIIPIAGTIIWYPQFLALLFFGLTFLSLKFWRFNKFISLLLIYESFSYLFITQQNPRTMLCLFCAFSGIALANAASKIASTKIIFNCIIGFAIFQTLYVILQSFNIDLIFHRPDGCADIVGFLGSHNQLGAYYASVGLILASLNPFLIIFSIIPIFLAKQNGAMIGLASGILLYSWFSFSKTLCISLLILFILLAFVWTKFCGKSYDEIAERIDLWKLSITQVIEGQAIEDFGNRKQVVRCNPFFGFGLGNFFTISPYTQMSFLPKNTGHVYEHAHNDLVEAFYELGYLGFILVLLCISSVVSLFIASVKSSGVISTFSCLVAQSVASFSIYIFHAPVSLFMFFLILGLFYAEVSYANKSALSKAA